MNVRFTETSKQEAFRESIRKEQDISIAHFLQQNKDLKKSIADQIESLNDNN
ncbi:MAG: hypothetical protein MHPSP_002463, partial [Paramarteilia canceri]